MRSDNDLEERWPRSRSILRGNARIANHFGVSREVGREFFRELLGRAADRFVAPGGPALAHVLRKDRLRNVALDPDHDVARRARGCKHAEPARELEWNAPLG